MVHTSVRMVWRGTLGWRSEEGTEGKMSKELCKPPPLATQMSSEPMASSLSLCSAGLMMEGQERSFLSPSELPSEATLQGDSHKHSVQDGAPLIQRPAGALKPPWAVSDGSALLSGVCWLATL